MSGLCTDLYELRMAGSYLRRGMVGPATFSLFVRGLPAHRGFLVAAGLRDALEFLTGFGFTADEREYLHAGLGLDTETAKALAGLRFTGDVWAVPEGRIVFADEPLLEVTAPIAQAQLVETGLLNHLTYQTAIASKAARCVLAAGGAQVVDFSFRRTHGIEASMAAARVSAIVGFTATSNVEAARRYGLVPTGTMAHSFVEAFEDERAAFVAFARDFPEGTVFLVDTYDTLDGVRAAIDVAGLVRLGERFGVRLDSGDLAELATGARHLLDAAGLPGARIVASGGLDEYAIERLVRTGAPIDAYGIGTKMGVAADGPSLDSAYKLVAYADRPVMKLSVGKATWPGAKQVWRAGTTGDDVIGLRAEPRPDERTPLLLPVMAAGEPTGVEDEYGPVDQVPAARRRFDADLDQLPAAARRLRHPTPPEPAVSPALRALRDATAARLRHANRVGQPASP
ncbi:MAG: nicotinate phosphoribosyltransferase [Betaproteobacteria bacterium]